MNAYPSKITNVCDFFKNIKSSEFGRSKGISRTVILFGETKECNVVAKFFLDITARPANKNKYQWLKELYKTNLYISYMAIEGLKYEAALYSYITEKIIDPGYSDNFIFCLGSGSCDKKQILESKEGGKIMMLLNSIYETHNFTNIPNLPVGLIVTQNVPNTKLAYDVIFNLNNDEKNVVMFQYTYAIALMEHFKISHNDLHLNNTLIRKLDAPKKYAYIVKGERYVINTRYIPIIFDWDNGYAEELGPNPNLTVKKCRLYNACSSFKYLLDIFKISCQGEYKNIEEIFPLVKFEKKMTNQDIKILNNLNPYWIEDENIFFYEIDPKIASELNLEVPPNVSKFILGYDKPSNYAVNFPKKDSPCHFLTTYSLLFDSTLQLLQYVFGEFIDNSTTDVEKTYIFPE